MTTTIFFLLALTPYFNIVRTTGSSTQSTLLFEKAIPLQPDASLRVWHAESQRHYKFFDADLAQLKDPQELSADEAVWLVPTHAAYQGGSLQPWRVAHRRALEAAAALNDKGNGHLAAQEFEAAIRCYEEVAQSHPQLPHARFNIGNALDARAEDRSDRAPELFWEARHDYQAAASQFRAATQLAPSNADFYRRLGEALAKYNLVPVSDWHHTSGTRSTPASVKGAREAEAALRVAGALAPLSAEVALAMGNLLLDQLRAPGPAAERYRHAAALLPISSIAYSNLATALMQSGHAGHNEEVLEYFSHALQLNTADPVAYNDLAYALMQQGQHHRALRPLQGALRLLPTAPEVHINLATSQAAARRAAPRAHLGTPCPTPRGARWHLCRAAWHETVAARHRLIVFEATAQGVPSLQGERLKVSVLAFLEGHPAATAPGGHALLAPAAYRWARSTSVQCRGARGVVPAQVVLDPPHSLQIRCTLGPHLGSGPLQVHLLDQALGLALSIQLCPAPQGHGLSVCTMPLFPPLPSPLLAEWLRYHVMLGVDHFYVYDRFNSFHEVVAPLVAGGKATHVIWPLFHPAMHNTSKLSKYYDQVLVASACVMRAANDAWVATIDPDEFVHLSEGYRHPAGLRHILATMRRDVSEVVLHNMLFPASVPARSTDASLLSRYTMRHPEVVEFGREKCIVRPQAVDFIWAHFVSQLHCGRALVVAPDEMRVNHYLNAVAGMNQHCSVCIEDRNATWALEYMD